jgi:hypothetical protein
MSERRFNEAEVAAIFEKATEAQHTSQRQLPAGDEGGMTLSQLQEIGREIGIDPRLIAQAARSITTTGQPSGRKFLGLPIGVGRTVDLGRKLSDEEWEQLVVELRETFDARGRLREEGSFRQWTNGNLQFLLEPTPTGHRLRMRTFKGDAVAWIVGGLTVFGFGAASFIAPALRGSISDVDIWSSMFFLGMSGLAMLGVGALRLPGWARTRQRQMEEIAGRLTSPEKVLPAPDRRE